MKIGYVTSSISYHGGWDTLSKGIVTAVSKHYDVKVLTAQGEVNDTAPYPIFSVLPKKYTSFGLLNQTRVFLSCLRHLRDRDAIHVLIEPFGPGAALASKVLGIPLFITLAGTYCVIPKAGGIRGFVKRVIMKFMYNQASFIATGSLKNIELIEEVVSIESKWKFVPFGVDPDKFKNDKSYPPPVHPFIFTVGAVKERKGADYVIRALTLIKDEFPNLHYKIAGSDKQKPGFVSYLKDLIKEKGLEDRVEILGRTPDEKLLEYYATCEVFVLAAQTINGAFEGFPMVFYEAHALGAPIITTSGFGSEYVIKDGYNGFLIPQGDYEELADAIRKIVGNPTLRKEMSEHGREEASQHTWDKISEHYVRAYEALVKHA